jgi:hypothetical protein
VDYTTLEELQNGWRPLEADEVGRATMAISDASVRVRRDVPTLAADLAAEALVEGAGGDLARTASQVVRAMVRRAMDVSTDDFGVTQAQESQGPFSRSRTYANPMGDLYTTKAERQSLGGGKQRAFAIDTAPPPPRPWWETLQ